MELERIAKELIVLARKDELSPTDHQRVRALMKELRWMGMTNAQKEGGVWDVRRDYGGGQGCQRGDGAS